MVCLNSGGSLIVAKERLHWLKVGANPALFIDFAVRWQLAVMDCNACAAILGFETNLQQGILFLVSKLAGAPALQDAGAGFQFRISALNLAVPGGEGGANFAVHVRMAARHHRMLVGIQPGGVDFLGAGV